MRTRLHRSEVRHQLSRIVRAGGPRVTATDVERALGYPLIEAGTAELTGVIAGLSAVYAAVYDGGRTDQ